MTGPNETRIQTFILAQLSREPRCAVLMPDGKLHGDPDFVALFWRQNTGAATAGDRLIRFGIPGQSDITGVVRGRRVDIEVKKPGGSQTTVQVTYELRVSQAGCLYILARSLDDVLPAIRGILTQEGQPRPTGEK
jgi:hypothetical protein